MQPYVLVCVYASENQRNELTSVHSISFGSQFFYVWRSAEKFKIQTLSPSKSEWKQTQMRASVRELVFKYIHTLSTRTCAIGVQHNTESNTKHKELHSHKTIIDRN